MADNRDLTGIMDFIGGIKEKPKPSPIKLRQESQGLLGSDLPKENLFTDNKVCIQK